MRVCLTCFYTSSRKKDDTYCKSSSIKTFVVVFLQYWRKKYSSNFYVVIFFSFYILSSLHRNSNSNTVGVLAFGINVFWPLRKVPFNLRLTARAKMSLSRAQNIFMPANINSIVSLSSSTCMKHKFNTSCKRFLTTPNFCKILPNLSLLYHLYFKNGTLTSLWKDIPREHS